MKKINSEDYLFMPEDHMDKLYNNPNILVRFVHRSRLKHIVENAPEMPGLRILDAGCGEGHLLEKLYTTKNNKNFYFGADITDVALKRARERCRFAEILKMDLRKFNFNDNSFDVVICSDVLEHVRDYEEIISELKRILKHAGILIITFPNEILWTLSRFFLLRRPIKAVDHVNSFTPKILADKFNLKLIKCAGIPFNLPFFLSLSCVMVFRK